MIDSKESIKEVLSTEELKGIKAGLPYEKPFIGEISPLNQLCVPGTLCEKGKNGNCLQGTTCASGEFGVNPNPSTT